MIKRVSLLAPLVLIGGIAQADTTLYGSIRLGVTYSEDKYHDGLDKYKNTDVSNDSSRFGIKGHEDLGDGLSAFYTYEFAVNADKGSIESGDAKRLSYVGLKHDSWGAVAIGAQWSPYYNLLGRNDIFNSNFSYDNYVYFGPTRLTDVVSYVSPTWSGLQGQVALIFNGEKDAPDGSDAGVDAVNTMIDYNIDGWQVGFTYLWSKQGYMDDVALGSYDLYGALIGYTGNSFEIALAAEAQNYDNNDNEPWEINIAGTYHLNEANLLLGGVSMMDKDLDGADDKAYRYMVGYQHNFSKRTRVWAEYAYLDAGDQFDELKNQNWIDFGIRTDF